MGFEFRPSESNTHFYLLYYTVSKVCIWGWGIAWLIRHLLGQRRLSLHLTTCVKS